jgi:NADPH2 dehydrogenase
MEDPIEQFFFVRELESLKLAYLHIVEARIAGNAVESPEKINFLVELWDNTSPVFVAGGFKLRQRRPSMRRTETKT